MCQQPTEPAPAVPTQRSVDAPARLPDVLAGLKIQAQQGETTGDIKTDAAFDADWLQRDRIAGASN